MRLYNGSTSWHAYRDVFQRLCKVNGWTSDEDKLQHLMLSLEGPAAELLRDFDDVSPTALADLWKRLEHRFGHVDSAREAKRRFEARRQTDTESVVEFEQALRTLHREAWPDAAAEQRDSALKRRFEDGVYLPELSQYLRLHTRDLNFDETVERARIFVVTIDSAKPKKAVRFVSETSNSSTAYGSLSDFDVTPLVNQLRAIEGKVDKALREKTSAKTPISSPSPSSTPPSQRQLAGDHGVQRVTSPMDNGFAPRHSPGRRADESWPSCDNSEEHRRRDFVSSRQHDFISPPWTVSDRRGDRIFNRSPVSMRMNDNARRNGPRRDNELTQLQTWRANQGYNDGQRNLASRYRSRRADEPGLSTLQQQGRATPTAARSPQFRQPRQAVRYGTGNWSLRSDFDRGRRVNNGCYVCGHLGCHSANHAMNQRGDQSYRPPRSMPRSPSRSQPENAERNLVLGSRIPTEIHGAHTL